MQTQSLFILSNFQFRFSWPASTKKKKQHVHCTTYTRNNCRQKQAIVNQNKFKITVEKKYILFCQLPETKKTEDDKNQS